MSGPKHLWSGDWQQESAANSKELADSRAKPLDRERTESPAPSTQLAPRRPNARRLAVRRALPIALAAVLFLAAGAWGLDALLGSSGPGTTTTAAGPTVPPVATGPTVPPATTGPAVPAVPPASTTASVPARPVNWLGMEIETLPPGAAVIETVAAGSPGQLAGLEPGDVIVEINNRPISATSQIGSAIRGLHAGDQVELQISRGSALYATEAILAAPPSAYP